MTPHEAFATLAEFDTSDDIATYLRTEGITGTPCNALECPIAEWLNKVTGMTATVGGTDLILDDESPTSFRREFFEMTPAMQTFIERFDMLGQFPELRGTA